MSLSQFRPLTKAVALPSNGSLDVRGLNFEDLTVLVDKHKDTLENLFSDYQDEDTSVQSLLTSLLKESPAFCAEVIALACDEPEATANARKLSFPVQVDALMSIGELTFSEAGGVKKFLDQLTLVFQGMSGTMVQLEHSLTQTVKQKKAK